MIYKCCDGIMLVRIFVLGLLCALSHAYNVEVGTVYPVYLRNGGSVANYSTSHEPAYSGYTFDVKVNAGNTSMIVGQPRAGVKGSVSSKGAVYYCNVKFASAISSVAVTTTTHSGTATNATTTVATTTNVTTNATTIFSAEIVPTSSAATRLDFPKEYVVPSCKKMTIFDATNRHQIGDFHKSDADALGSSLGKIKSIDNYTICTPLRKRECPGANKTLSSPGACYYGNPQYNAWTFMKWNESRCFGSFIDIIFVVDGSGSIGIRNFDIVRTWLINIISSLVTKYGDSVRTEVLQYSDKDPFRSRVPIGQSTKFEIPFTLNQALTIAEMGNRIRKMKYLNSQTYTYYALRRVMEWEFEQSIYKAESKKVVVVLTDGAANDGAYLSTWYNIYGATGRVIPFAVGVGSYNIHQLRVIANGNSPAGSLNRVLTVTSFNQLQSMLSTLTSHIVSAVGVEGQSSSASSNQGAASATNNRHIGSSVTSLQDGSVHIGTVGMYLDSGGVMQFNKLNDATPKTLSFSDIAKALPERTNDSYLGYAIVSGYFNGNSSGEYIAVGAPRYKMKGSVVVYRPSKRNSTMQNRITINPPKDARNQIAAYFGGCLLSLDVSGDGYDDLFISSPLFVGTNYDEGRVSVYIGKSGSSTTEWVKTTFLPIELSGDKSPGARFGSAMVAAGDINLDGYQDVIIGAPLADGGRGVVFIYHGMSGGINQQPSQKISSSSLSGPSMKYFGQSLQGKIDVDGNGYPDVFVGAPRSDSLILLKSRPIIKIHSTIEFTNSTIDLSSCMDSKYRNCATLKVCFHANGTSVEKSIGIIYNLTLDPTITSTRVTFNVSSSSNVSQSIVISTNRQHCFMHGINLKKTAQDFYTAIEARVDFDLTKAHTSLPLSSVLDRMISKNKSTTIVWRKNCKQNVCIPNLGVTGQVILPPFTSNKAASSNEFAGTLVVSQSTSGKPITVKINITNTGENSFNTNLKVTRPSKVSLTLASTISSISSITNCVEEGGRLPTSSGGVTEQFYRYHDAAKFMRPNSWCFIELTISFESLKEEASANNLTITASVYSSSQSSKENDTTNNNWNASFPVRYQSDISLRSEKPNAEIAFNYSTNSFNITSAQEIGINTSDVDMDLRITSGGYSNIPSSEITFTYPWLTTGKQPLLYLYKLECSTKSGKALCICDTSKVNPYNLLVNGSAANTTRKNFSSVQVIPSAMRISDADMLCPATKTERNHVCETFKCSVTNLYQGSEVHFKAYFRLWTASFNFNDTNMTSIQMRSNFKISTSGSPLFFSNDLTNVSTKEHEIIITARKFVPVEITTQQDNLLIYILAIAGGFLLLFILILILWKVGFFKKSEYSKKMSEQKEMNDGDGPADEGSNTYVNATDLEM